MGLTGAGVRWALAWAVGVIRCGLLGDSRRGHGWGALLGIGVGVWMAILSLLSPDIGRSQSGTAVAFVVAMIVGLELPALVLGGLCGAVLGALCCWLRGRLRADLCFGL